MSGPVPKQPQATTERVHALAAEFAAQQIAFGMSDLLSRQEDVRQLGVKQLRAGIQCALLLLAREIGK